MEFPKRGAAGSCQLGWPAEKRAGIEVGNFEVPFAGQMKPTGNGDRPGSGEVAFCCRRRADLEVRGVYGLRGGSFLASCEGENCWSCLDSLDSRASRGRPPNAEACPSSSRSRHRDRRPRWLSEGDKLRPDRKRACGPACGSRLFAVPDRVANPSLVRAAGAAAQLQRVVRPSEPWR